MIDDFNIQNELTANILFYAVIFSHILFTTILGAYLILNLQWYNYKINRVIFKHHKQLWHFLLFYIPLIAYLLTNYFFWLFFYFTYTPLAYKWFKKLDKPLLFTPRVKRFFLYLIISSTFVHILAIYQDIENVQMLSILSLFISIAGMNINEYFLFLKYKKNAKDKLAKMNNLQIIQITASYGKTSIKNFIYEFLSKEFIVYQTPKSVNTINGIVKDINNDLPINTKIYIVESGARQKGDIKEITNLLNPHFVILGKIGAQHIEYFKTKENIIKTKSEILYSDRLQKAFIHKDNIFDKETNEYLKTKSIELYPDNLNIIESNLKNTKFLLTKENIKFTTRLLGRLNPENIAVAIGVARYFGANTKALQDIARDLDFIPHRLEKIENMGKIIIDDSYNSNLDGMLCAINLAREHTGKKIIVTCGLIESDEESNIKIAKEIDRVFDIVVVTSVLNKKIFDEHIKNTQKFTLEGKNKLQTLLARLSKAGDIILFANDAPSHI